MGKQDLFHLKYLTNGSKKNLRTPDWKLADILQFFQLMINLKKAHTTSWLNLAVNKHK